MDQRLIALAAIAIVLSVSGFYLLTEKKTTTTTTFAGGSVGSTTTQGTAATLRTTKTIRPKQATSTAPIHGSTTLSADTATTEPTNGTEVTTTTLRSDHPTTTSTTIAGASTTSTTAYGTTTTTAGATTTTTFGSTSTTTDRATTTSSTTRTTTTRTTTTSTTRTTSTTTSTTQPPSSGSIIYLRFDESAGSTAYDSSSGGNDGTLRNGPTWIVGRVGGALRLDGVNDYVDAGSSSSLDITGPMTIMAWVNPQAAQEICEPPGVENGGNNGIAGKVEAAAGTVSAWSWQLRYGAPTTCYLGFNFNDPASGARWVSVGQPLASGQWHHVAATFDGSTLRSYLNGAQKESATLSSIRSYPTTKLIIGSEGWGNYFRGAVDDLRIYRRALSAAEISQVVAAAGTTTTTKATTTTTKAATTTTTAATTTTRAATSTTRTTTTTRSTTTTTVPSSSGFTLYPWEPTDRFFIGSSVLENPSNRIQVSACRGEYEPASFFIRSAKDVSGITVTASSLQSSQGNTIPASAIDVRLVKAWYQASQKPYYMDYTTAGYYLTPELLLKDDTLVRVDTVAKRNYLKVTIGGVEQYIDISSPTARVPQAAQFRDAAALQPFSLKANENKQVWVTVHVPDRTPAGTYSGDITISAPSEAAATMRFSVTVLPFDLEPAPLDYGLFYINDLNPSAVGVVNNDRTAANMLIELQNMKNHGVLYPLFDQHRNDAGAIESYLDLRDQVGFPKDKIYVYGWCDVNSCASWTYIGNPTDASGLAFAETKVDRMIGYAKAHGYAETYFYGMDEATGATLQSERQAWQMVHDNGGKIYATSDAAGLAPMVDILDTAVVAYGLDSSVSALWHSRGHKILSYGNPQTGVENPEIYRMNYGVALWNAGYDGSMDFAYQWASDNDYWNDYGDGHWRDHMFTYPTSNGVVDTIQWEGFREGVDDTRYVATLNKLAGSDATAKSIVSSSLAAGDKPSEIRKKLINKILELSD